MSWRWRRVDLTEAGTQQVIPIIPMKPLAESKTRLAGAISDVQRRDLVMGMLGRVITAVKGASMEQYWVVGGDDRVRSFTQSMAGCWLDDPGLDLNDTLAKSFGMAFKEYGAAMYLPADLPFLKTADLHAIVRSSHARNNITLAPARKDGGTNAILVPGGVPFQPELGPNSFSRHVSQAARIGVSVAICYSQGTGLDLDTPEDLQTYGHIEPGLLHNLISEQELLCRADTPHGTGETATEGPSG